MSCNKEWLKRSNSGQKSVRNFEEHQPNCCGDSRCDNSCNRCSGQCAHDQHQGSMLPRGRSNNIHQGSGGHGDCCSGGNTQDGNGQSSGRGQYYNEHNRQHGPENGLGSGRIQNFVRLQYGNEHNPQTRCRIPVVALQMIDPARRLRNAALGRSFWWGLLSAKCKSKSIETANLVMSWQSVLKHQVMED